MGLLDIIGGMLGGRGGGNQNSLLAAALEFINNQPGGLNGLIEKFRQGGAGDIIGSWIGSGDKLPISPDMLQNILGSDTVTTLASKAGVDPAKASGILAQVLPFIVSQATQGGTVPANGQISSTVLSAVTRLTGLFGGGNKST